ncbi:hypothetical protein D051_0913 [Vibrio parahaemolyticus VPCR-2010]|nr:hypothetical protein D051_0913 [Vibrio parahaemolyticus VPCR-2010]
MSEDAIKSLVSVLTVGDFAIYPESTNKSLVSQVIEHLTVEHNIDIEHAVKKISSVDLWSAGNEYNVIDV